MNLEQFLEKRLTKEQMEGLNPNSKIQKIEEGTEDNKLIITLPKEILDMIDKEAKGKEILKNNIVTFIRELKKELGFERDIVNYI
ncbi:hypothetical protein [uncultured Clostridium sp.]|uniref:hypothetical protein n=1 Tax=uncultured Clostridium sp. TaxID=59620 RepID=UPI002591B35D|nr:hypothetical protein [uncultured Clostridium sp.]